MTIVDSTAQPTAEAARLWAEAPRAVAPDREPFPLRPFVRWLVPGLVGVLLLGTMYLFLHARGSHEIVYVADSGGLASVHADGTSAAEVEFANLSAPSFGAPQWSPTGRQYAAVAASAGGSQIGLVSAQTGTRSLLPVDGGGIIQLPGEAWSASGTYLAVAQSAGPREMRLLVANAAAGTVPASPVNLDARFRPDWHPQADELLATARTDNITPTLQLVKADGTVAPFAPQDGQAARFAGAWSPDGQRVAYVTSPSASDEAGSLWIANRDGANPLQVITDGLNLAPRWAPHADQLFFTHLVTETGDYELRRINLADQQIATIGPSVLYAGAPMLDPRALMDWSPDGTKLFFQGTAPGQSQASVYVARADGSNPVAVRSRVDPAATTVRWTPTSRALLIAPDTSSMALHWLDEDRAPTSLGRGRYPTWQP